MSRLMETYGNVADFMVVYIRYVTSFTFPEAVLCNLWP